VATLTLALAQFLPMCLRKGRCYFLGTLSLVDHRRMDVFKFPLSLFNLFLFARQRIVLYGAIALFGDVLRASCLLTGMERLRLAWSGNAMVVCESLMSTASWYLSRREWRVLLKVSFDVDVLRRLLTIGVPSVS